MRDHDRDKIEEIYKLNSDDYEMLKSIDFLAFIGQSVVVVKM